MPSLRALVCLALGLSICWATESSAEEIVGRVVHVQDGDTLTILVDSRQVKVRLTDIDAPELKQPFGKRSRQALAEMCAGKEAQAIANGSGKDPYGRMLARIKCVGVDANEEMVSRGLAWVFVRYAPKNSPLYALEREARLSRRGLWVDDVPVPPWEWRAKRRK